MQSIVAEALFLPGRTASLLLIRDAAANAWRLAADDLPAWPTSAWLADGTLWLIGALDGELMHEERVFRQ